LTVNASGVVDGIGKMAPSGNYWSGDFLNYVTMTRMDALRKVLYGGYRSTDTATDTVLQRVFVPQDAHSWGKEYESIERDGYDIAQYTPLSARGRHPASLVNTTLSDSGPITRSFRTASAGLGMVAINGRWWQ
jgi:type IV pilus assembly protein PilY1